MYCQCSRFVNLNRIHFSFKMIGLRESDIRMSEEGLNVNSELCSPGGYLEKEKIHLETTEYDTFGSVQFVQLHKEQEAGNCPNYTSANQQAISPSKRRRECMNFININLKLL